MLEWHLKPMVVFFCLFFVKKILFQLDSISDRLVPPKATDWTSVIVITEDLAQIYIYMYIYIYCMIFYMYYVPYVALHLRRSHTLHQ